MVADFFIVPVEKSSGEQHKIFVFSLRPGMYPAIHRFECPMVAFHWMFWTQHQVYIDHQE
jgi:hypothetical protein